MDNILTKAIESVQRCEVAFCKFLSANDTKSTKAHQSGYLISITAWATFFDTATEHIVKKQGRIRWQDDFETPAIFTRYESKGEFRLTGFGRGFPFREEENVGDLFILCKKASDYFEAFILQTDDDIDDFFAAVNISSADTNKIIPKQFEQHAELRLQRCFELYLKTLKSEFPTTVDLAINARNCYISSYGIKPETIQKNPDAAILNWLNSEFQLFKIIENDRYTERIHTPFKSVEELVITANTILNRRKSRAGSSLEHHLSEIFNFSEIAYSAQAVTEQKKKPDFLFPKEEAYHNPNFDSNKLIVLAAKTTCKDRWRQILNEADRIKLKHLFTLQQGISKNQLDEMYNHDVCLVVPKPYLSSFPQEFQGRIKSLEGFINDVKKTQC